MFYIKQSGKDAVTDNNGLYDLKHFSQEEQNVILRVLENAEHYTDRQRGINLMEDIYSIMYKARYILLRIVTNRYECSNNPLDQLATAISYSKQGAMYRTDAISHYDIFFNTVTSYDVALVPDIFHPYNLYDDLADLTMKAYRFEAALQFCELARQVRLVRNINAPIDWMRKGDIYRKIDIHKCIEFYKSVLNEWNCEEWQKDSIRKLLADAEEKSARGYKYKCRPYKPSEHDLTFYANVDIAAKQFDSAYHEILEARK